MKKMKTANKTKTIQVRLTQEDYDYLTQSAWVMGTNPSRLVRQLIQMSINAAKATEKARLKNQEENDRQTEEVRKMLTEGESSVIVDEN